MRGGNGRKIPEAGGDSPGRPAGPARPVHRRGIHLGVARQPVSGLLGRVFGASQVHRRRQHRRHRLERLRQDRPVLHQEVPGRDQPDRLPRDGSLGLDGVHLPAGADQIRIRDQPGGGPLLLDDPAARPGRLDRVRSEGSPEPGPGQQTVAARQYPVASRQAEARLERR